MTTTFDIDEIERLLAAATPGEWVRIGSFINGDRSFVCSMDTDDLVARILNAALIVTLHNSAPAMIAELRELRAENARLREANGILEDGLEEVGDDYPGSSCQEWCQHQIKQARAALGEPQ